MFKTNIQKIDIFKKQFAEDKYKQVFEKLCLCLSEYYVLLHINSGQLLYSYTCEHCPFPVALLQKSGHISKSHASPVNI